MSEEPSKLLILLGVPVCRSISPKSPLWHDRQADFSDEPQTLHSVGCRFAGALWRNRQAVGVPLFPPL